MQIMDYLAAQLVIGIRGRLAALAKACDGTTAVETAIVLPAYLLFLFAIIEGGLLFWTQTTLQSAVEAAARCAAINGAAVAAGTKPPSCANAGIPAYAASQTYGMTIPSSTFTPTQPSCGYQVSASYPFSFIVSDLYSGKILLSATSCFP